MRPLLALAFLIVPLMAPVAGQDVPPDASDRILVLDLRSAKPGAYPIVVLVAPNGTVSWKQPTVVDVGGGSGGAPLPPTTPKPPVQPPTPPPLTGLAAQVVKWAEAVDYPAKAADAMKLAAAYEKGAAEIEEGKFKTPPSVVVAQLQKNLDAVGQENHLKWLPFTNQLANYLTSEVVAGRLSKVEQHAPIWRQIAAGLRAVKCALQQSHLIGLSSS